MTVRVLQSRSEIAEARRSLVSRGVSRLRSVPLPLRVLRRLGFASPSPIGDRRKSWDVALCTRFLEEHVSRSSAILDLGAYASELPYVLHAAGYTSLFGIDFDPRLAAMPLQNAVHFIRGDFHRAPLRAESIDAITSISVIEHGFSADALFGEASRLLRPGGYFIASCDYWPEKIDTADVIEFGVSWTIFSRDEILAMVEAARHFDLHPTGAMELDARDRVIDWNSRKYTFAWLALRKGNR